MGIKSLFKHLLLTIVVLSMYACGGGGESSHKTIIEVQKQQSTNLVFADQNLTDCVQALIDSEGYTLIEQITELSCIGKEIADIEGIQNLSFLEILNLSQNQIRDITPISKLGRLKQLYLQGNNLQLLSPIAKNQLLEQVDISDNDAIICSEQTQLEAKLGDKLTKPEVCIEGMQQAETATFEDANLQACIRQTAQEIGAQYLEQIQQLKCVNHAISNIDGIEQLTNLRELDLTQNNISDITPLENLSLLKKVLLGKNQISNIQPLTTSKYMQELRLDYNQLADIQGVETLDALRQIHLTNNDIRDLTPLQSLTELLELRISNNRIIDIQALANIPKLTSLWIQGNQIADLAPLQSLQHLEQLWLSNNWLTDLTPLQTQSKLKWLHLDGTEVADLNPLNKLTQLKWLQLDNTAVVDITAIYPLTKLDWLHLKGNNTIPCSQLDHMEDLITAEKIDRPETCSQPQEQTGNPISIIEFQDTALRNCVYDAAREQGVINAEKLTTLSCPEAGITDITGLTQFPGITSIDLTGNDHISCAQLEELRYSYPSAELILSEQCNLPPTVAVQQEQTVETGTQVDLNAEATDPNGDSLTYKWQQTAGQSVQLTNPNTATPNFTAPQGEDQTITLQLTVTDQYGLSTTQAINILVTGVIFGSKENPFLVTNYEDLKKVGTGIDGWNLDSHYLQTADIDATPSKTENPIPESEGEYYGFEPIGKYSEDQYEEVAFTGGYDGGGFTIDGLTIKRLEGSDNNNYLGFFGYAANAEFSNINLLDLSIDVENGNYAVGGIVGYYKCISHQAVFDSNSVYGEIAAGFNGHGAGGLAGSIVSDDEQAEDGADSLTITNSYFIGVISGHANIGGLVGYASLSGIEVIQSHFGGTINGNTGLIGGLFGMLSANHAVIKDSYSGGEINISDYSYASGVGGISGIIQAVNVEIMSIYSEMNFSDESGGCHNNIGGLFGMTGIGAELIMKDSFAQSEIELQCGFDIGGVFGTLAGNNIYISDSYANVNIGMVEGGESGGFAGKIGGAGSISNVYAAGDIQGGTTQIGGLVGILTGDFVVSQSYALGDVIANEVNADMVGGAIGFLALGRLEQVYATGNVVGIESVGGLVGLQQRDTVISNSYARGNVTGNFQVGGLVGQMYHEDGDDQNPAQYSSITNSYSTGQVSLQNEELEAVDFGGLVGASTSELNTVSNSFWDIETSGQETSAGGTAKTSEELKTTTTFTNAGWDFEQTWMILSEGYTYPRLAFNTVEVGSWTELQAINQNLSASVVLTRDLLTTDGDYAELAGPDANDGKGWEPVGTSDKPFMGTFDGGGFTIDGLTINRPEEGNVGIFGFALNSNYKNINISNSSIKASGYVGGIIGYAVNLYEPLSIVNSLFSGEIVAAESEGSYCGGIAGRIMGPLVAVIDNKSAGVINCSHFNGGVIGDLVSYNDAYIKNTSFDGEIIGEYSIGGVVGNFSSVETLVVDGSFSSGEIRSGGGNAVGGLLGNLYRVHIVDIKNSHSDMNIMSGGASWVGGFIGYIGSLPHYVNINSSYATGNIIVEGGANEVGGFIGYAVAAYSYVTECYATGNVTGNAGGSFVGGMFGFYQSGPGFISNSYATGNVHAANAGYVGGLSGILNGAAVVYNSYYDGNVIGGNYTGGLIGRSEIVGFENSYASGTVSGNSMVGGLIGAVERYESKITKSYSDSMVVGTEKVGGLIGDFSGVVDNSYALGDVTGDSQVGGLIGNVGTLDNNGNVNETGNIYSSYSQGDVEGNYQVGGLVGQMHHVEGDGENPSRYSFINNSYSTGLVQLLNQDLDPIDFGGLVGASTSELNATSNSFWDTETSDQEASVGGIGLMTTDMQDRYTFESAGWDYYSIWGQEQNQYPHHLELDEPEFIEFQNGSYSGTFTWDCYYEEDNGSTSITFDLTEANGFITGTASYSGGTAKISLGNFDKYTGAFSLRIPKTATNVANIFHGYFDPDNPGEKISGSTTEGATGGYSCTSIISLY